MKIKSTLFSLFLVLAFLVVPIKSSWAGGSFQIVSPETDGGSSYILVSIFDLRDRESLVQVTNTSGTAVTTHVQIFTVNDSCRENNFFDTYTGNDTHVYNMRDILTNNGNPSGVVLEDGAYGMVVVTTTTAGLIDVFLTQLVGNFRILDDAGYEYRTNSAGTSQNFEPPTLFLPTSSTGNFNKIGGVTQSDVFNIVLDNTGHDSSGVTSNPLDTFLVFDLDICNLDEVPFSCPDFIAACSVAGFEYGINEAIPSSKEAPPLCPNNVISDGFTRSSPIGGGSLTFVAAFLGLNNGNGRGSMDQIWLENFILAPD